MCIPGQGLRGHVRGLAIVCLLAGLLPAGRAMALDPQRQGTQYIHDAWQSDDGLPQNSVFALEQTRDGYLWAGTWEGLARFDGSRFTVFDKRNTMELRNHVVLALAEDDDGVLWIGTGRGLVAHAEGRFQSMPGLPAKLSEVRVSVLLPLDDTLWVGSSAGLWQVPLASPDGARQYTEADGLPSNTLTALAPASDGELWVGTSNGLARLRGGRLEPAPFPFPGVASPPAVSALRKDGAGVLWVGTSEGLFSWDGVRAVRFTQQEGVPAAAVSSLRLDGQGNLWVGFLAGGLVRHNASGFSPPMQGEGLAGAGVLSMLEDRDGQLWVGTYAGLHRLRDGPFVTYGLTEGLRNDMASAVLEDRHGTLWVGTLGGGLHRLVGGVAVPVDPSEGLSEDTIAALSEAPDGTLWVATMGGAYRFDGRRFTRLGRNQGLPSERVISVLADSRGDVWLGTPEGLVRLHGGVPTVFGARQGVSEPIISMVEAPDHTLWLGADSGLLHWDGKDFRRYTQADGLPGDLVLALWAEPDGTLWVGTETGLGRFKDGAWARFTVEQGLHDDAVFSLVPDGAGSLWMSSNKGVSKVLLSELGEVAEGARKRVTAVAFDTRDGMRSAECNGNTQPSGFRARDGKLWFNTIRGVVGVDPQLAREVQRVPEVRIEEARVQGRVLPVDEPLELPEGASRLEVRFTAFMPGHLARVPFRYRLEGYDEGWVSAEGRRTATYTGLRPGRYRFEVTAASRDGMWAKPATLDVVLTPRLWQRTGFWALCILGVGVLATSVYLLRVGQLKARERRLEERVRERTRELAMANEELEANMRTLRATQAQLLQAGRMAAVGQLAAGVGHEINNPLAYIVSNLEHASSETRELAEALGEHPSTGPRLREISQVLREALHGAERVRRIVRDLKTFSRRDDEAPGPVDLNAVVDSAAKIAAGELRPRARLVKDYGEVPRVEGNEARLAQVFLNLLINAAQAVPEGHVEQNEVRLVTRAGPDGTVVAEVHDTGSGIAPGTLGHIFDPFFTTKPVGVGTGLGLSLCHAYVTGMGGQISVESEVGKGSVFRVTLKAMREVERVAAAEAALSMREMDTPRVGFGIPVARLPDGPVAPREDAATPGVESPGAPSAGAALGDGSGVGGASAPAPTGVAFQEHRSANASGPTATDSSGTRTPGAERADARSANPTAPGTPPQATAPSPATANGAEAHAPQLPMPPGREAVPLPPAPSTEGTPPPAASTAPTRGRVLVVDDDALVSGAIRRTLSREHDVEVMVSPRQALERLCASEPRYDVVLCDLMMPELTGMDLYDALVAQVPRVAERVVFITGGAFTPAARLFLERVSNPRVEKPFDPEGLRKLVRAEVARARSDASGRAA